MLSKEVGPSVTDEAVHARYDQELAGKPGEEEVHARHILVDSEAEAKKIIAQLKGGGDFAALAKQYSKDPSGAQQGGDLGFFKKDEMVPEFATAAFALQPGQVSPEPVHSQFGWHVILLVERRHAEPPSFDQARDELRQKMIQEGVQKAVAKARAAASVEKFNLDGSQIRATDTAEPPPAAQADRPSARGNAHGHARLAACRSAAGIAAARRRASGRRGGRHPLSGAHRPGDDGTGGRHHGRRRVHLQQVPRRAGRLVPRLAGRRQARVRWW